LRMDDISLSTSPREQSDAINWAVENKIAFSFGIVTSDWPSDCLTDPKALGCESLSAQAVNNAYTDGHVLGTSEDAFLEICGHSFDHTNWAAKYKDKAFATKDFEQSGPFLRTAFPKASIRTFIAPETFADSGTLDVMLDHDFDIMSAQGQLGCNESEGEAPQYNYMFAPCEDGTASGGDCIPPNDIYFTEEGMQKMKNGIISLPTGSANSHVANPDIGRSVDTTIGLGECGCTGDEKCPLLQNAYQNSRKSNGLWWTVLMMHPQTDFQKCCNQSYKDWLEEFLVKIKALEDYEIHFVTFQDLAKVKAPPSGLVV